MDTLRRGSTGSHVRAWQRILGIEETGAFDENTDGATRAWQAQRGLEPDGEVGRLTWGASGVFVPSLTSDIDDGFFPRLRSVATELDANPRHMLGVMYSEGDGCRANAWNDNPKSLPPEQRYNASGLIQFMPPTLVGLGWSFGHAAFRELTATQQLEWVLRYYRPYRGHLGSVGGLYTATFLPALVAHAGDPNFVLTAKAGVLPWAYGPNAAFDANRDLRITVGELELAVARNCVGARWDELVARLTADVPTVPELENPPSSEEPVVEDDGGASRREATFWAVEEAAKREPSEE